MRTPAKISPATASWAQPEPLTELAPSLTGPILMSQEWRDVAFLHWFIDPALTEPFMPPGVRADVVTQGQWAGLTPVALVPFTMVGAGLSHGPPVPYFGTFWETNVRLYSVDRTGRRGIVFRSLAASRLAVVLAARGSFNLPYWWAKMRRAERISHVHRELVWASYRRTLKSEICQSRIALRVGAPIAAGAEDIALATFLSARWGLHTEHLGRTWYIPNEHEPWPLHRAELVNFSDSLLAEAGFPGVAQRSPDHIAFAPKVHTRFGLPVLASRPRR